MAHSVLISGVFDPLHAGHLAYIRAAMQLGTVHCHLSDNAAKHPPLVPREERAAWLQAVGVRSLANYPTVADALRSGLFTAYVKGADWNGRLPLAETEACIAYGIEIIYTDTVQQSSSTLLADYQRRLNAEKLAQFETFVQAQQPASKPWAPVTDYSFEARTAIEGPHAQLIWEHLISCEDADVLDYGCGPEAHVVRLLREYVATHQPHSQVSVVGYDPQIVGSEAHLRDGVYDLVICREVLEHLTVKQLTVAVRHLVKLSSQYIYVTTRFTAKPHLLDVDGSDDLDPTHISLLHQDFLRTLFVLEGCTRRADLEEKLDHQKKGRVLVYEVPAR